VELIRNFFQKNKYLCVLALVTFVSILSTGIGFHAKLIELLPLFVSLVIMILQANVNRYALLMGALNSLLYCYYYYTMGLMSNCLSAVLVSFPFQLISFFTWSRKSKGSHTELRSLSWLGRGIAVAVFLGGWIALWWAMGWFQNSSYSMLDTLTTTLGLGTMILTLLRYSEYVIFQAISGTMNIWMYAQIVANGNKGSITYLIYSVYCLICIMLAAKKLYQTTIATSKKKMV
jgi:nicotinamide riboside transporter PnuC